MGRVAPEETEMTNRNRQQTRNEANRRNTIKRLAQLESKLLARIAAGEITKEKAQPRLSKIRLNIYGIDF
jgi:hypothetical protein